MTRTEVIKNKRALLSDLRLGSSIAELDELLDTSYVESNVLTDFINDRYDIIKGAKGTGKSALLLYVYKNKGNFSSLDNVIFVKANEHSGEPSFKRAFRNIDSNDKVEVFAEAWKIYLINIIWDAIKYVLNQTDELESYLNRKKILTKEKGTLARLLYAVFKAKATVVVDSIEIGFQLGEVPDSENIIDYNYIFQEIDNILKENHTRAWILLDRLDDAFPDWSDSSLKSIKSLFYVYKDLLGLKNLKLKTFIRTDIFDRITLIDGFTSLSHIRATTSAPIKWDEPRIKKFIVNRFKSVFSGSDDEVVELVIGSQVDKGERKTDSFHWVINHLKDGNTIYTPRDILDFLDTARQFTLNELESGSIIENDPVLFSITAMKRSWIQVSRNKCETQLYAENPELRGTIELFRDKKSEYTIDSLKVILGKNYIELCRQLEYVGFIGKFGDSWKIPFLYRPCLNIKQGKM